jgi:hypothetical protein
MAHLTYAGAIVVGLVQGVTELFPVPSLGHNVLIPALPKKPVPQPPEDRHADGPGRRVSTGSTGNRSCSEEICQAYAVIELNDPTRGGLVRHGLARG